MASFILMNKNTPMLAFEYDMTRHEATRITRVENIAYAPMGMTDRHGEVSKRGLNYWWRHRAIPASRAQVARLLENLRLESTLVLVEKSFGLSLSDCYWMNDEDDPKEWVDVNFFDNDFSDDLGFLTLGQDSAGSSPDRPGEAVQRPLRLARRLGAGRLPGACRRTARVQPQHPRTPRADGRCPGTQEHRGAAAHRQIADAFALEGV